MALVEDVSNWKKWWSMRWIIAAAFLASIPVTYATLPEDWLPSIPDAVKAVLAYATLVATGLAGVTRVMKQKNLEQKDGN